MNRRQFLVFTLVVAAVAVSKKVVSKNKNLNGDISLWGHSFFGNNSTFSSKLIADTGRKVYNFGLSGSTSVSIALRNDAYRIKYIPAAGALKEGEKTPLLPNSPGPLSMWANSDASWFHLPCRLSHADGVLDWDGKQVTFTAKSRGIGSGNKHLYVYPFTTISTDNVDEKTNYPDHPSSIYLLWLGRNNSTQPEQILSDAKAIISRMDSGNDRFVVLPEFPSDNEVTGSKEAVELALINKMYRDEFPDNYCEIDGIDLLKNFINHHNPDYSGDLQDIKSGLTPRSLREDGLHPSISKKPEALYAGTEVNAEFVARFLKMKGWV